MKKQIMAAALAGLVSMSLAACGTNGSGTETTSAPADTGSAASSDDYNLTVKDTNGDGLITVGVAQVGAESGWRIANTQSYKDTFVQANGFQLVFEDANQDSDMQKQQVRDLISQGVEVIVLDPVTDSGWEPVLQEAKDAGIPVINADRQLAAPDNLYMAFLGSDMLAEGQRATAWLQQYIKDNNITGEVDIAHLQGTIGATAQVGRSQALTDALAANPDWKVVWEQGGDFNQQTGQQVFQAFLQQNQSFKVLYSENDDMTYGAIDAMTAAGLDPKDYIIISFDGNKKAVQMVIDGTINIIGQCNPLIGPQIGDLIKASLAGQQVNKNNVSDEILITPDNAQQQLLTAFGS